MKTISRYDIKECTTEIRIRTWRDLDKIVPFAADSVDPNPEIVASFFDEKEAREFLATQESYVKFFTSAGMIFCTFEEYILERNIYSVDEDGDLEWIETTDSDYSCMPETITFGGDDYAWEEKYKCWRMIEDEEDEE